ncbi:MAG: c-type cytochrome [Undibacterium sp.]|nr:c-type cytochrome [Opitutaceae bacterium]
MIFRVRLFPWIALALAPHGLALAALTEAGPFFEKEQPFFQSQVEIVAAGKGQDGNGNFVVRGIVLPLASGHAVVFDQELLRIAAVWKVPAGQPPVTLMGMAQISYSDLRKKADSAHPQPSGPALLSTAMHPGIGADIAALHVDARPAMSPGDVGRGALPAARAHFEGVELARNTAVLCYRNGDTAVSEWLESRVDGAVTQILRHLEVAPHAAPLVLTVGATGTASWAVRTAHEANSGTTRVGTNTEALVLSDDQGELVASLAPSTTTQRVSLGITFDANADSSVALDPTPPRPVAVGGLRWPALLTAPVDLGTVAQNGLVLDRISVPEANPWNRRVRVADIAFLTADRAAVVTYDGDVWLLDGVADDKLAGLKWRRFASGLQEPLAIAAPGGVIQVATKNGVVRLYDRDGNGEADWFENFNDQMIQSQTTRSFPLDMAMGPDGSTYITQGGIVNRSGMKSGGEGTSQTGAIFKISPDGRSSEVVATGAREPFVAVNSKSGVVTATDQQGHFIPSSVSYLVRPGDNFGFLQEKPAKLTPPLAWIPYEQDNSSSSEVWMNGAGMGAWNGRLVHLSFGTGRLFVITPDLDAPIPQGAVIPLELKTDLPLLHARMNQQGDALWTAGFQLYGSRVATEVALGRLRRGVATITTAVAARSTADGVVLEFAAPLDPTSVRTEKVSVRAWNYRRSSAYGSGRYTIAGEPGTTPWGIAQTVLSEDGKSVFVHLPKLPPVMQLEVRHDFMLAGGTAARGVVYFTIHGQRALDLATLGFAKVDLTKQAAAIKIVKEEPPTAAMGKGLSESLGCVACHSIDGTTEGKIGPTWKNLFGTKRTFVDGGSELADEFYIRDKILDPQGKRMKAGQIEMPSYRGVVSEGQMEALVLYIKTLAPKRAGDR